MELIDLDLKDFKDFQSHPVWIYLSETYLKIRLESLRNVLELGVNSTTKELLKFSEIQRTQAECAVIRELTTLPLILQEELERKLNKLKEQKDVKK